MKMLNNARKNALALVLAAISLFALSSCAAPLRTALTMKPRGLSTTYPLSYDQTYTAMRAALRWSSDYGIIEDHKEQGYLFSIATVSSRYGTSLYYDIIWLDFIADTETRVTILTSGMTAGVSTAQLELQQNMDYAARLLKDGKPLPIMSPFY